jgi:hypothetical protein
VHDLALLAVADAGDVQEALVLAAARRAVDDEAAVGDGHGVSSS